MGACIILAGFQAEGRLVSEVGISRGKAQQVELGRNRNGGDSTDAEQSGSENLHTRGDTTADGASSSDFAELYESEKTRRRQVEVQLEHLRGEIEHLRQTLRVREEEIRYRLGDALVRAAKPSLDTLKLPFRMIGLFVEGVRKAIDRRRAAANGGEAEQPIHAYGAADTLHTAFGDVPESLRGDTGLRIAAVTDEFSWWAWGFEAELFTFRPDEWRSQMEKRPPHLLLIESAWRGIDNTWYHQVRHLRSRNDVTYVLPQMAAWCRSRGIPTVFYNKEDPPNFNVFIEAAACCDHILTSDANCIPEYVRASGNNRVHALPFAAQPRIHNPVLTAESRQKAVCFAGTWYNDRHADRRQDAISILEPALEYDLDIYDRMAGAKSKSYHWPKQFQPAVRGGLAYPHMLSAYKQYKVFLNVNSVKNSPTMFSRRVFELLACGTPVISSHSDGIQQLLGNDIVLLSESATQTRRHLERLLEDDDYRERLALRGQRRVFSHHTYAHRLHEVLERIGLQRTPPHRPTITMIAAVADNKDACDARVDFERQDYPEKRLLLCLLGKESEVPAAVRSCEGECNIKVADLRGRSLSGAVKDAAAACDPGYLAALDPGCYYAAAYLTDYANVTLYLREPIFGKSSFFREAPSGGVQRAGTGEEYRMAASVNPATVCIERDAALAAANGVGEVMRLCDWWNRIARTCARVYSTDRFNFAGAHNHGEGAAARSNLASASLTDMADALV